MAGIILRGWGFEVVHMVHVAPMGGAGGGPQGRDANQSDFIVFSTTNRAKYDNTILPIKIRFSPNVCLPLSLSLFFLCISYQTITLVWHFISLLSSGETLPK